MPSPPTAPVAAAAAVTGSGTSAFSVTTPSFTPPANSLVLVAVGTQSNVDPAADFSISADTIGGLTWTLVASALAPTSGGSGGAVAVWAAVAGASPPTGTVTVHTSATSGVLHMTVRPYTITGQGSSPIGATAPGVTRTGTSGTFNFTLPSAPDPSSLVVYALGGYIDLADPTITDDAAFTQVSFDGSDFWSWLELAYCRGSAPTSFAPSFTASSFQSNAGVAFEVVPAVLGRGWVVGALSMRALEPIPLTAPSTFDTELGGTDAGASGQVSRSYTNQHGTLLLMGMTWATGGNDPGASSLTDTGGLTWVKLAESIKVDLGNPSTVGIAVYGARAPSTPTSGTVTVTIPAHAAFDMYPMVIPNATAAGDVASGHSATANGNGVTSLTPTLGTAPTASQGTLTGMVNWPHKTITEATGYTEIAQNNNPGGSGPYGQQFRFAWAYDYSGPGSSATLTNAVAADSAAVIITITPDTA